MHHAAAAAENIGIRQPCSALVSKISRLAVDAVCVVHSLHAVPYISRQACCAQGIACDIAPSCISVHFLILGRVGACKC